MRYFSFLSGTVIFGWAAGCATIATIGGCGPAGSTGDATTSSSSSGAAGNGGATSSSSGGAGGSTTSSSSSGVAGNGGAGGTTSNSDCLPSTGTPAPVDAALPGESSECQALGIVACRREFSGWAGEGVYDCVDANGGNILHVEVSKVATIPCSQAQLDAWVVAYATPCWRLLGWPDMPPSAITLLVDPGQMPQQVCSNVDGTSFRWSAACAEHVYRIGKTTGGGNFNGTTWSLGIAPASTSSLRTGYPFLACPSYNASKIYGWHVDVKQDAQSLAIHADDIAPGGLNWSGSWQDVLDQLVANFTTCDAQYWW